MDYLRTIKLGYGKGTPNKQACWMTALQAHIGGSWTDRCDCVDLTINALCIRINDLYLKDDQARTEDILEFGLFEPLGTWDKENAEKRRYFLIDRAMRYWKPLGLRRQRFIKEAERFEKLCPIVDEETATRNGDYPDIAYYTYDAAFGFLYTYDAAFGFLLEDRRKCIKKHVFPVLRQLIDMGKHGPYETEPVCGVEKFKELVGVK